MKYPGLMNPIPSVHLPISQWCHTWSSFPGSRKEDFLYKISGLKINAQDQSAYKEYSVIPDRNSEQVEDLRIRVPFDIN
jgi:hypothetical protein